MTDEEIGLIDGAIKNRVSRFETELKTAYTDSATWIERDIYHVVRSGAKANTLMTRAEKLQLLLDSISSWGDE